MHLAQRCRDVSGSPETFAYDTIGRVISHGTPLGNFTLSYLGETSQSVSEQVGSGVVGSSWAYDSNTNDRRLKSIVNSGAARGYQFATNPESIITGITETATATTAWPVQSWNYTYDAADRLLSANSSSGTQYGYGLDAADNLTALQGPTGSKSAVYNNTNQLNNLNGQTLSYDTNGNLTDDGVRTYQWDAENRLIGIGFKARPDRTRTFRYDGEDRRIAIIATSRLGATETRYLWCGNELCQARTATDVVSRRYFPEGEVNPVSGALLYYAKDHLGSVRDVLTAQNGLRVASYDYDPYGAPSQTAGRVSVDFRYAGLFYLQDSGLYLTKYRVYDPRVGRWLSRDPIEEAGGVNLYGYVGGNPVSRIDPLGLMGQGNPLDRPGPIDQSGRVPRTGNPISGPYEGPPSTFDKTVDKILDFGLKQLTGVGGLITKNPVTIFIPLMTHMSGLGGCDENGVCSDQPPKPQMCPAQ